MEKESIIYFSNERLIENLKNKGLKINNAKFASEKINEIGYYKLINGYKWPFKNIILDGNGEVSYVYKSEVNFKSIYSLYMFDKNLIFLTFRYLLKIENYFKNIISNVLSEKYGANYLSVLKKENFHSYDNYENSLDYLKLQIDNSIEKNMKALEKDPTLNNPIIHHIKKYSTLPLWVVMQTLTFGEMSNLFALMKTEDKNEVGKRVGVNQKSIKSFLHALTHFRNKCAHFERLYCNVNKNKIHTLTYKNIYVKLGITEKSVYSKNNKPESFEYERGIKDYLSLIIMFKILLSKHEFKNFFNLFSKSLLSLKRKVKKNEYKSILCEMGLIGKWKKIKNIHMSTKRCIV